MAQFTIQELKWLDQSLRRDIENSKTILSGCEGDPPQYKEIIRLDMANKETLRAKVNQTMERVKKRAAHRR